MMALAQVHGKTHGMETSAKCSSGRSHHSFGYPIEDLRQSVFLLLIHFRFPKTRGVFSYSMQLCLLDLRSADYFQVCHFCTSRAILRLKVIPAIESRVLQVLEIDISEQSDLMKNPISLQDHLKAAHLLYG